MNRFFTDSEIIDNKLKIENEDVHHIKDVLRLKENDRIICVKNKKEFLCNIDKFEKNSIILRVEEKLDREDSTDVYAEHSAAKRRLYPAKPYSDECNPK